MVSLLIQFLLILFSCLHYLQILLGMQERMDIEESSEDSQSIQGSVQENADQSFYQYKNRDTQRILPDTFCSRVSSFRIYISERQYSGCSGIWLDQYLFLTVLHAFFQEDKFIQNIQSIMVQPYSSQSYQPIQMVFQARQYNQMINNFCQNKAQHKKIKKQVDKIMKALEKQKDNELLKQKLVRKQKQLNEKLVSRFQYDIIILRRKYPILQHPRDQIKLRTVHEHQTEKIFPVYMLAMQPELQNMNKLNGIQVPPNQEQKMVLYRKIATRQHFKKCSWYSYDEVFVFIHDLGSTNFNSSGAIIKETSQGRAVVGINIGVARQKSVALMFSRKILQRIRQMAHRLNRICISQYHMLKVEVPRIKFYEQTKQMEKVHQMNYRIDRLKFQSQFDETVKYMLIDRYRKKQQLMLQYNYELEFQHLSQVLVSLTLKDSKEQQYIPECFIFYYQTDFFTLVPLQNISELYQSIISISFENSFFKGNLQWDPKNNLQSEPKNNTAHLRAIKKICDAQHDPNSSFKKDFLILKVIKDQLRKKYDLSQIEKKLQVSLLDELSQEKRQSLGDYPPQQQQQFQQLFRLKMSKMNKAFYHNLQYVFSFIQEQYFKSKT